MPVLRAAAARRDLNGGLMRRVVVLMSEL